MSRELFIGLMSGTSLDGADSVVVELDGHHCQVLHQQFTPYPPELRQQLLALHTSSANELEITALTGNTLSRLYAENVQLLLSTANLEPINITAIGCHGQTIRHRPELGFTLQIFNPALLTELTGITVVADFRSRDLAAGGHGAPLVPAFHQALFADAYIHRVLLNIGGIANLTDLAIDGPVTGFDTGPGNMLMDAWIEQHQGKPYDAHGSWAASGQVIPALLEHMLAEPFFTQPAPKSTGRDTFNTTWLAALLHQDYQAVDVQRTLLELTAQSIATAVTQNCSNVDELYVCGGGAYNSVLLQRLQQLLQPVTINLSDELGLAVNSVEAAAFAWLARQAMHGLPGNLPAVTGAKGPRILGAVYAA
ncbi:anhydro-N-acetylmuramic acid kinase [Methylobacillus gramineus]|uniref:anhydro-N-acetylmuramic acid kinase n=1 Tax=Methylobacillus gramineus TaxID=755169 RepID=UPI001CFF9D4B|nr:anhydro-N-acetylmuramic acid kinase [Methylobacillus gramineus]MCB5185651.1 anhydro-N-acetylmuramic acid kinase [Methylobacillus gramineus]